MKKLINKGKLLFASEKFVAKGLILSVLILLVSIPYAYSIKSSITGYGYGYDGYGYGFGYADAVPSAVSSLSCSAGGTTSITCTWTAPTTTTASTTLDNLSGYRYTSSTSSNSTCNTGGSTTTSATATISSLTENTTYYIAVCAFDDVSNYSSAATTSVATSAGGSGVGGGSGGGTHAPTVPATPATPAVPGQNGVPTVPAVPATPASPASFGQQIADIAREAFEVIQSKVESLLALIGEKRDLNREVAGAKYLAALMKGVAAISQTQQQAINNFVTYGTKTTVRLGAGERAGVVSSFKSAFGKLPTTEKDWNDAIKIANGRWPEQRNTAKETKANVSFKKVYKREPNRLNANDDAAVTIITYGLRSANRNLNSEKVAIKTFKNIYGANPKSAADWDIARSIAYSGAKR